VVSFSTNITQVLFEWPEMRLQARLIDERYPDYKNAIPKDLPITALLDRKALIKIINRVSLFAGSRHELAFAFQADGSLSISAFDLDYNKQCKEKYECREYKGDPITIGFDGRLLAEGLSVLQSDEVFFSLSGHNRAMTIEPIEESEGGKVLQLLMPVMLNNNYFA
jgi:DNA polymerase-3 subunit beta